MDSIQVSQSYRPISKRLLSINHQVPRIPCSTSEKHCTDISVSYRHHPQQVIIMACAGVLKLASKK